MDLIRLFVSEQVCPTEVNDTAIAEMATVIRATALIVNTPPCDHRCNRYGLPCAFSMAFVTPIK